MSARLHPAPLPLRLPARSGGDVSWAERLAGLWRAQVTRRQLRELDGHLLRDIGITAAQARREADRLPWDV